MLARLTPRRRAAAALALVLLAGACSPTPDLGDLTVEQAYEAGTAAAARGDNLVVVEAMNRIVATAPLHELADDALLALGDAHRGMRDFATAEGEYRRLTQDYPGSPLVAAAEYKIGLVYYDQALPAALDQTMTERAIMQFRRVAERYPGTAPAADSEARIAELRSRLAQKDYETALLYVKLKSAAAARVYLEAVARDYPETPWAPLALLAQARSLAADGEAADAAAIYGRIVDLYPGTEEAKAAAAEMGGQAPPGP